MNYIRAIFLYLALRVVKSHRATPAAAAALSRHFPLAEPLSVLRQRMSPALRSRSNHFSPNREIPDPRLNRTKRFLEQLNFRRLRGATKKLHGGAPHKESQPTSEITSPHTSAFYSCSRPRPAHHQAHRAPTHTSDPATFLLERNARARILLPEALASVPFGCVFSP